MVCNNVCCACLEEKMGKMIPFSSGWWSNTVSYIQVIFIGFCCRNKHSLAQNSSLSNSWLTQPLLLFSSFHHFSVPLCIFFTIFTDACIPSPSTSLSSLSLQTTTMSHYEITLFRNDASLFYICTQVKLYKSSLAPMQFHCNTWSNGIL